MPASPTPKPKLGYKWVCYRCQTRFYDLERTPAICPKCEANQHEQPLDNAKPPAPSTEQPREKKAGGSNLAYLEAEEAEDEFGDTEEEADIDIDELGDTALGIVRSPDMDDD